MKTCSFREFQTDYSGINTFNFETKMTDFDNAYSKKSITGIIATLTEDESGGGYVIQISYRTSEDSSFSYLVSLSYHQIGQQHLQSSILLL